MSRFITFGSRLIIRGNLAWKEYAGKCTKDVQTVMVSQMGDLHPFRHGPSFSDSSNVILDCCDKNFVYYWAHYTTFPQLDNIFLFSHPCEPIVLQNLLKYGAHIFLHEAYASYQRRWVDNHPRVTLVHFALAEDIVSGKINKFHYPFYQPKISHKDIF